MKKFFYLGAFTFFSITGIGTAKAQLDCSAGGLASQLMNTQSIVSGIGQQLMDGSNPAIPSVSCPFSGPGASRVCRRLMRSATRGTSAAGSMMNDIGQINSVISGMTDDLGGICSMMQSMQGNLGANPASLAQFNSAQSMLGGLNPSAGLLSSLTGDLASLSSSLNGQTDVGQVQTIVQNMLGVVNDMKDQVTDMREQIQSSFSSISF